MRISPASLRWPLVALLSGLAVWEASRAPQAALAALLLGSLLGLGLSFLTAFAYLHVAGQRRLGEAERLWHAGQPASAVSEHLAPVVRAPGELGYRILLLRAKAHAALEWRNQAWQDLQQAQLRRLPWRLRRRVARFLEGLPTEPSEQDLRQGEALLRACPNVPRIHHGLGLLHLRRGEGEAAWDCFGKALPLATEDFLLLEDVLRAAQDQPARRALAEEALRGLLQFHGDPRVPWDRASGARFLVNQGRFPETVALLAPLPPRQRTQPWHWAGLAIALRGLGDPEGAWREVESGLEHHPQNFRLWMERFQLALDDSKDAEAESSLEEARRVLPPGPEGQAMQWEWLLRKAEFEYWARGGAQAA